MKTEDYLSECKRIVYEWGSNSEIFESYFTDDEYWGDHQKSGLSPKQAVQEAYEEALDSQP